MGMKLKNKKIICDALRDLLLSVQFKNLKNTHGEELVYY